MSMGLLDRVAAVEAAVDALAAEPILAATHPELVQAMARLEVATRKVPAIAHPMINRLSAEASPIALGGKNLTEVLSGKLRISTADAGRRITDAQKLGPRTTLTGQPLAPQWPTMAAAQRNGLIGEDHLRTARKFFTTLPAFVDAAGRADAEELLGTIAGRKGPKEFANAAAELAYLLNQDGDYSDEDRAHKRDLTIGKQDIDGMSKISGYLTPAARALWDAVAAKLAAPGACNPEDHRPCLDGEPSPEAVTGDTRTQKQRNHDAFAAMCRALLACGTLGQVNGLPASLVILAGLHELEAGHGDAHTGGGTRIPITDVLDMATAGHTRPWLAIFDNATDIPLHLFRSRRLASPGQRLMLYAKERGCTFPDCTVAAYGCQVHHCERDWVDGGLTNITDETLACPPHNRLATEKGWKTIKRQDGTTEWHPPPHLDHGQDRVNKHFFPEKYLYDDADTEPDTTPNDTTPNDTG